MLPTCTEVEPETNKSVFQLRVRLSAVVFYKGDMDEGVLGVVISGSCGGSERRSGLFFPRDFVIAKIKKRGSKTRELRELAHVGLWAVTCRGCILWVCFCSATLPI